VTAHRPVLLDAAIEGLAIRPDGFYIDGTYGRGGHAEALLERLDSNGRCWLVDRDPLAIASATERHAADPRVRVIRGRFSELGMWLAEAGLVGNVQGLLLDLGVSSPQLDQASRGFSFMRDGPLDMRMDPDRDRSALEWLARVERSELVRVLRDYGEERFAGRVASAIVAAREADRLPTTTRALADLVAGALPRKEGHKHPATRTFQAIRIAVNDELGELQRCLAGVCEWLAPGGRLVVISFHSLEDRMVKQFIRDASGRRDLPASVPCIPEGLRPKLLPVGRAGKADADEISANPRARSARVRVAVRLP
jgi:16S rRNA (cytosine1402-N4)-methyltransferase